MTQVHSTTPRNGFGVAFKLAFAYLSARKLASLLNILLLALGVGTVVVLLLLFSQAENRMEKDAAGIDLVVGAKGSPLQLVLSGVFHADIPTGNIPLAEAKRIMADPAVKRAVPLSLGDSYRGFRIVGSNVSLLSLYAASVAQGRQWEASREVTLGATVAAQSGLSVGAQFAGAHGLTDGGGDHAEKPLKVVGILAPTGSVVDRLILTSLDSVWDVHDHDAPVPTPAKIEKTAHKHDHDDDGDVHEHEDPDHDREITALLIQYASPIAAMSFPKKVNANSALQAASPAYETARLFALLGIGVTALRAFAAIMMLSAALGVFIGLISALQDRRADLALLRVLGANRSTVFLSVILQGVALGIVGVILGFVLGHGSAEWIARTASAGQAPFTGWIWHTGEWVIGAVAIGLCTLAASWPAWQAYRGAVPEALENAG